MVVPLLWKYHSQSQRTRLRARKSMEERSHLQSGSRSVKQQCFVVEVPSTKLVGSLSQRSISWSHFEPSHQFAVIEQFVFGRQIR